MNSLKAKKRAIERLLKATEIFRFPDFDFIWSALILVDMELYYIK